MKADGIRPAAAADLDALKVLEDRVFAGDRLSRRSLRYYIGAATVSFLVMVHDGVLSGDAIVAFRRRSPKARLYSIAIAPDVAGRGHGGRLLTACENAAVARGCTALRLEVRNDNAGALRFYERAGYGRIGLYADYYEDGADALRFEKRLADP